LGFEAIKAGDFIGVEEFGASGSDLIDKVGEGALKGFDGGVFVVGAGGSLEKA
jgi:hypothetical protein